MRYVTYITEVSFKTETGQECIHEGWVSCEKCEPNDLTLIGHWDLKSTIHIARSSFLGMHEGVPTKELLVQYFAIDGDGKKVPPNMLEHYSAEYEGPSQYIIGIDNTSQPRMKELVNEEIQYGITHV